MSSFICIPKFVGPIGRSRSVPVRSRPRLSIPVRNQGEAKLKKKQPNTLLNSSLQMHLVTIFPCKEGTLLVNLMVPVVSAVWHHHLHVIGPVHTGEFFLRLSFAYPSPSLRLALYWTDQLAWESSDTPPTTLPALSLSLL